MVIADTNWDYNSNVTIFIRSKPLMHGIGDIFLIPLNFTFSKTDILEGCNVCLMIKYQS